MIARVNAQNMVHDRAVAFEGNVCTGKSTVSIALTKTLSCDRYSDYMDSLPFDHPAKKRLLTAEQRLNVFLAFESKRLERWRKDSRPCVLLDRSVLSILAFEYAMRHVGRKTAALERVGEFTSKSIVPAVVIWFRSEIATAERRWITREGASSPIYVNKKFGLAIDRFYRLASKHISTYEFDTELYATDVIVESVRKVLTSTLCEPNQHALSNLIMEAFG